MDWIDIVIFLSIQKILKSKDVINFCNSNSKIRKLCNTYSDTIWTQKLLHDYKISKDEIIGDPKSYYIGLENDIYQYYFFDIVTDNNNIERLRVENITEEESIYENHFKIPGIEKLSNVDIVVGIFEVYAKYETGIMIVYSKTLEETLNKLNNLKEEYYPSEDYTDISNEISTMNIGTVLKERLDIKGPIIYRLYYPVDVEIRVFKVTL